ncbi:hypothetical protein EDC01DRAFT_624908 [Geopyxis carbonaria]|nr:hypothetical protein EDC01DRAFT_624908 [Geopyxis carbonaria]
MSRLNKAEEDNLNSLRNLQEFAALGQFLFCFGSEALGLPEFDQDDLERGLLAGEPELVQQIKISLLKSVSSHRGLTPEQFEEYTRRLYLARKAQANPFGDGVLPIRFIDLDLFQRVIVLYQMSLWALAHPEQLRDKMKDCGEKEQLTWRIEPCGFDRMGNKYYILDDNRLYKQAVLPEHDHPIFKLAKRSNTRSRMTNTAINIQNDLRSSVADGWSCLCVTPDEWIEFAERLKGTKSFDEKALHKYIEEDVIPVIQSIWAKKIKRQSLENAMANRKRSSRLNTKLADRKIEHVRKAGLPYVAERTENIGQLQKETGKQERQRESRIHIREKLFRELELLSKTYNRNKSKDVTVARRSSRHSHCVARKQDSVGEQWVFDCTCGVHGTNLPDGTEIIACDCCDVWQHVHCQQLESGYESSDFICDLCQRL